jgi:hypothetical protein
MGGDRGQGSLAQAAAFSRMVQEVSGRGRER